MKKYYKYLWFPLSFLALFWVLLICNACYQKFWLNTDPKGIYSMGIAFSYVALLCTIVVALVIRSWFKPQTSFSMESLILLAALIWAILETESLEIVIDNRDRTEFVILYDQRAPDRLRWRLSENKISLSSLPLTITNRRRILIGNDVEITKRTPSVYLPLTNFYTTTSEELEFQRMRYLFTDSTDKSNTVDYYYQGSKWEHQDSLLNRSELLANIRAKIEGPN